MGNACMTKKPSPSEDPKKPKDLIEKKEPNKRKEGQRQSL
jgi:hypothetical protein